MSSLAAPTIRIRPTARVFVLDEEDRLLLLRGEVVSRTDPAQVVDTFWHTPGGGVEAGETFRDAAKRELWEETGLDAPMGPLVWTQDTTETFPDGPVVFQQEFFLVRVPVCAVTFANIVPAETGFLQEFRWWAWDELQANGDGLPRLSPPASVLCEVLRPFVHAGKAA